MIWLAHPDKPRKAIIQAFWDSQEPGTSPSDVGERTLQAWSKEFEDEAEQNPSNDEDPVYDIWNSGWQATRDDVALHFRLLRRCRLDGHDAPSEREVKWMRRLEGVFKDSSNSDEELMRWSRNYARRETLCRIIARPLDTTDLDYCLAFRVWEDPREYNLAVQSGTVREYREQVDLASEVQSFLDMTLRIFEETVSELITKFEDMGENHPAAVTQDGNTKD